MIAQSFIKDLRNLKKKDTSKKSLAPLTPNDTNMLNIEWWF